MSSLPQHPGTQPIDREEWDRFPLNRWAFQHVREVVATTEVWRGSGPTWALSNHPHHFDNLEFATNKGIRSLCQWLDDDYCDGFIVLKNERIIYQRYRNHMTERSLHLSQSVAKSVTSCVAGILIHQGLLDPDQPITHYLPELASTAYKGATLRHALDMASGVHYVEDYESPVSHIAAMDIASGWKLAKPGQDRVAAPDCMWDHILSLSENARDHGQCFNYRSIETDVIAHCLERVSHKRLAQLVSELIWQPLGCEESACFTVDRNGYASASGGFNASLRDYARFGQMLCNDGIGNNRVIVPSTWISDTLNEHALPLDDNRLGLFPNGGYRNQFWLRDRSRKILMARGIYGQLIYVDQAENFTAVILASWPESTNSDRSRNALNAIDRISASL